MPTTAGITRARVRLGAAPLRLLFARVAGACGTADTPGVFYQGLRVLTVDGFTLDLKDTPENAEHFGGNGSACASPYPQLRALVLAESGTRSLLAAAHGPCRVGEKTLALDLLSRPRPGDAAARGPELELLEPVDQGGRDRGGPVLAGPGLVSA